MTPNLGIESGPQWWEASALTLLLKKVPSVWVLFLILSVLYLQDTLKLQPSVPHCLDYSQFNFFYPSVFDSLGECRVLFCEVLLPCNIVSYFLPLAYSLDLCPLLFMDDTSMEDARNH